MRCLWSLVSPPGWMAGVTSGRRIDVSTDFLVLGIGGGLAMRVAVDAGEYLIVGRIGMAVTASGPDLGMVAGVDRKLAVCERGAGPGGGCMTIRAGSREPRCRMIRIVGCGVFG